jgi:hypothetical protein
MPPQRHQVFASWWAASAWAEALASGGGGLDQGTEVQPLDGGTLAAPLRHRSLCGRDVQQPRLQVGQRLSIALAVDQHVDILFAQR